MTGLLAAIDRCYVCRHPFAFDPDTVPSVLVDPASDLPPDLCDCGQQAACLSRAVRRPVCPDCVSAANRERARRGLPPFPVAPGARP